MATVREEWIRKNKDKIVKSRYEDKVSPAYAKTVYDARDYEVLHGTYQFEMQMLEYIKNGRTDELKKLLMEYTERSGFTEGRVAGDELRQSKNIFIALVAMVGKMGAIPGGMPVEQAYYLIDTYTQQCEKLESLEEIYILQYNMLLDFSSKVEKYHISDNVSPVVRDCINYIIFHLNEPIRSFDVIEYSGKSKSFLSEKFKKETGSEIGTYITNCKIDEAKTLLRFTDKPISEISNYLSFSSQPYFQNVFKKVTGMTPFEYRNRN